MKIIQQPDGSADFVFTDEEIKTMQKTKKLHLHGSAFKHVVNTIVHVMMRFTANLDEASAKLETKGNVEVETK